MTRHGLGVLYHCSYFFHQYDTRLPRNSVTLALEWGINGTSQMARCVTFAVARIRSLGRASYAAATPSASAADRLTVPAAVA